MPTQNYLYRGGEKIVIEKQSDVFTTILPNNRSVQTLTTQAPIEEVQHVFNNVYKITTQPEARDEVMQNLRVDEYSLNVVHHAYHPTDDESTVYYLTDMLTVAFQMGASNTVIENILQQHGLKFIQQFEAQAEPTFLLQVTKSAGKNPIKVSEDLQERPEIVFAEPNLVNRFQPFYTPQDALFRNQWHLKSTSGVELSPDANIDAAGAWDVTRGSRTIVVAVLDDGFDLNHPDFKGLGKVTFARDFVDADLIPFPSRQLNDFHGTPCAGLAIGEENGTGIVGVAPGCTFMPVRFGLTADDKLLYEIFDYIGKYADVISCSWGPVPVNAPLPTLLNKQMTSLSKTGGPRGKGCVIVFAAGNYNAPVRDLNNKNFTWRHPTRGLKQTTGPIVNGHAAHPDVIAVSASTSQNRHAAYSNWGADVDVCAPSDNVHPIDFQIRQPGQAVWTSYNENLGRQYTDTFGGTSASAPMVAGVAALILSANPALTASEVREILQLTADKITDDQPDPVLGLTKGRYNANGHSEWFGFGKVNAFKAVRRALELVQSENENELNTNAVLTAGIHISAAMVNPKGNDRGEEMLVLLNATNQTVDLVGWAVRVRNGEQERIPTLIINSGNTGIVFLSQLRLSNLGGRIILLNPNGVEVDEVFYSMSEGLKEGWWVKF